MNDFRLKTTTIPKHYHVIIKPSGNIFGGICYVTYEQQNDSPEMILHGADLQIVSATLNNVRCKKIIYVTEYQQVKLIFDHLPRQGTIKISYVGQISSDKTTGVYKSIRKDDIIISTQFQSHYARYCFPCFDEPCFKATFQLEIFAPKDKIVLSNTPEISQKNYGKYILHTFATTPKMSTYIVAFYIGTDNFIEDSINNISVRVYSYKDPKYSQFALKVAIESLRYMTEYFGIPYPLKKMDLVSLPKFMAGAMENWGLITFTASALLCQDNTTPADKLVIATTVSHEIAHQWFGNLVTMEWWSDLWLNESFATWMSWETLDHIFPEWRVWEHYYKKETTDAFELDSMTCSHSICNNVTETDKIMEGFDSISYAKGSNIIRLVIKLVGVKLFREGIRHYLQKHSYGNATTDDLWESLEFVSQKSIKNMMHNWLNQKNYPYIHISYHGVADNYLDITQYSFCQIDSNILWSIPLTDEVILSDKRLIIGKDKIFTKINKNVWGFYRICYSKKILSKILSERFTSLSMIDLSGMVADLFALLFINQTKSNDYFARLKYIVDNISTTDLRSMHLLLHVIYEHFIYTKYVNNRRFLTTFREILKPFVMRLEEKYSGNKSDDLNDMCAHDVIFKLMCELRTPLAIKYCIDDVADFFADPIQSLNKSMTVTFPSIIGDNNELFDKLFVNVKNNPSVIYVLGFTNDLTRYIKTLDLFNQHITSDANMEILFRVAGKNKNLNKHMYTYIKKNWDMIWQVYQHNFFGLKSIIGTLEYIVCDDEMLDDIKSFFKDKVSIQGSVQKMIEKININKRFVMVV
uniref:Aminopeptidase n=1 Tax=viral metagenome TaxID=1070528 RepID=A0A6C0C9N1_9ZZZZ